MLGYAICGSFCNFANSFKVLNDIVDKGYEVLPIMSDNARTVDTRFGLAVDHVKRVEDLCSKKVIDCIEKAEPLGPVVKLDALIICPCTGNTLAKLAGGIADTPVLMASKAHLRNDRPLIIALCSNDAMSSNLENIAKLVKRKNIYFVPMIQDDVEKKPHSLVADFSKVIDTIEYAMKGKQIRPLFLEKKP